MCLLQDLLSVSRQLQTALDFIKISLYQYYHRCYVELDESIIIKIAKVHILTI